MNLPETDGIRPQEDFLIACKVLDQEYATTCLRDLYKAENNGTTDALPSLDDFVAEFTAYLRRNKIQSTSLSTAAAGLELSKLAKKNTNGTNFCPTPETLLKVEQARRDPKIKGKITTALKKWGKRNQKQEALQIDDGLPPSNLNACVMFVSSTHEPVNSSCSQLSNTNSANYLTLDENVEPTGNLATVALEDNHSNELLTRWIVSPGSNTHVINSEAWKGWKRERENTERRTINAGNSSTLITAWGSVELIARTLTGLKTLHLTHVAYVEGFLTSVIGLARCRKEAIHFDSGRDVLYRHADLSRRFSPTDIKMPLSSFGVSYRPSYIPKPTNTIDRQLAYQIWDHPSKKAIDNLEENVNGISVTKSELQECSFQICMEAKLTKIISRRPAQDKSTKPFYRIGIDLVYVVPLTEQCWNGDRYMLHAVDEYTKWHEVSTIRKKSRLVLMRWIKSVIRKIGRVFDADVCCIRSDNEQGFGNDLVDLCAELGIILETTTKYTPEQNGLAERAGGTLTLRARAMRIQGNLPKSLANEIYKTAALLSHMCPIGCLAYVLNKEISKGDKTESRALIGHLVGYQGTNIFRIWLPTNDEVIVTRDVEFNRSTFYPDTEKYVTRSTVERVVELLEYPETLVTDITVNDLLTNRQRNNKILFLTPEDIGIEPEVGSVSANDTQKSPAPSEINDSKLQQSQAPEGYRAYGEPAPKEINLNPFDTSLIVTGKRNRKPPSKFQCLCHTISRSLTWN
ncbi:hypothetical protein K3495_g10584 [Podosphaera aphanis]|nr:hypothetical protein K3495_g10584 [Podosphaera aphanis]